MIGHNFEDFLSHFEELRAQRKSFVVITLVHAIGSAPQDIGARAIVQETGLYYGTVGGGRLEKFAIEKALEIIKGQNAHPQFSQINLQKDLGMSCGGAVSLFFEPHLPEKAWSITVFGAGHVAQELIRTLIRLECEITCVDSRKDWLDKLPQSPKLRPLLVEPMESYVEKISQGSFVAIMTMGHKTDLPILKEIFKRPFFPYLGVIGSEVKAKSLKSELALAGVNESQLKNLRCPIGESFGTNSPAEIALSITAELLKVRDQIN